MKNKYALCITAILILINTHLTPSHDQNFYDDRSSHSIDTVKYDELTNDRPRSNSLSSTIHDYVYTPTPVTPQVIVREAADGFHGRHRRRESICTKGARCLYDLRCGLICMQGALTCAEDCSCYDPTKRECSFRYFLNKPFSVQGPETLSKEVRHCRKHWDKVCCFCEQE